MNPVCPICEQIMIPNSYTLHVCPNTEHTVNYFVLKDRYLIRFREKNLLLQLFSEQEINYSKFSFLDKEPSIIHIPKEQTIFETKFMPFPNKKSLDALARRILNLLPFS